MVRVRPANKMFPGMPSSRLLKQAIRINKIHGDTNTAFTFDPKYTKFELIFPQRRVHTPSIGIRHFWKHNLPALKFHNFDRDFAVRKVATESGEELQQCPVKLVVHETLNKVEIDCGNLDNSEILAKLIQATGASPVPESDLAALDIKI